MKTVIASLVGMSLALSTSAHAGEATSKSEGCPAKVERDVSGLSEIRQKMFAQLKEVIPSVFGQRKTEGRNLFDGTKQMTKGTTCGLLPAAMLSRLGLKGLLTSAGTEGVRLCGQGLGIAKEPDGSNAPKPGDVYWLRYPKTPNTDSVAHVGVIYEVRDDVWITADAGQGSQTQQAAKIVCRVMKKVDGKLPYLGGPQNTPGDSASLRRVGGWIDLDELFQADKMAAAAKLKIKTTGKPSCQ